MSSRRQQITLEPEVLRWARERVGLSPEDLAKKISVNPERITEWEQTGQISIAQADKLAAKAYTPLGYLYLPEPPEEPLPIRDFRTPSSETPKRPSADLLDTVYLMQRGQTWMRDDLIEGGAAPLEFVGAYSQTDSQIEVAEAMRTALGLADDWVEEMPSWSGALRFLRNQLDEVGVLVVFNGVVGNNNYRKRDPKEFQGFALVDEYAPLVFVNSADFIAAQISTLMHEVVHLFVGETGLSAFDRLLPSGPKVEFFCNQIAAEFLVPQQALQELWPAVQNSSNPFQAIAQRFRVSAIVAARRLLDMGQIDRDTFIGSYNDLKGQEKSPPSATGGGNFWNRQRWRLGPRFAGAAARAAKAGRLPYREAYSLTGLNGDTFERMAEEFGVIL